MSTSRTKGQIISDVRVQLRQVDADSRLPIKAIWSAIDTNMRTLIQKSSDRLKLISLDTLFQTRKCVEVVEAPVIDNCCGIRSRCTIYRTRDKLPAIYEDTEGVIIKSIFSIDGSSDFTLIKITDYQRKLENPHSKYDRTRYTFYNNGYLYFPNQTIKSVMVKAYFEDEVINTCDGAPESICIPKQDEPFRLPDGMQKAVVDMTVQSIANITLRIPPQEAIDKNEQSTT